MAREMVPLYERVKSIVAEPQSMQRAHYIHAINILKRQRNAVILTRNYQVPENYHTVAVPTRV